MKGLAVVQHPAREQVRQIADGPVEPRRMAALRNENSRRKTGLLPVPVLLILASVRQRKDHEPAELAYPNYREQLGPPSSHGEDALALRLCYRRILHRQELRQIVSRMTVAQEVRIEPDDQGVRRIVVLAHAVDPPRKLRFEIPYRAQGTVPGPEQKEAGIQDSRPGDKS